MKNFAASNVYKKAINNSEPVAFAVCQKKTSTKEKQLSVKAVGAKGVRVVIE